MIKILKQKRTDALMLTLLTFFCQLLMITEIWVQILNPKYQENHIADLTTLNPNPWVSYGRFVCATVLHLSLIEEVSGSLLRMKYVINHRYLFAFPSISFIASLL